MGELSLELRPRIGFGQEDRNGADGAVLGEDVELAAIYPGVRAGVDECCIVATLLQACNAAHPEELLLELEKGAKKR